MAINDKIMELIKKEIAEDPDGRGYAGKTDEEIQKLLNEPYIVQTVSDTVKQSRISIILAGIPNTPNVVDSTDVLNSKQFVVKEII